ncbi:MAG: F0F1 ATP synthase subunit B [Firmicutes bacterium]|nr:F0F1 ATP synthase subunit B [Bacillota bacterium]
MEIYTGLIEFNWTLVMVWVTVLVLYLILKRNFFDKINNFITARQEGIQKQFDEAEQSIADANAMMAEYKERIANVESEGREIIADARERADMQAKKILNEANVKATAMLEQATNEIEREKSKAVAEMKQYIADLAICAAEQILEKQIDAKGQAEIVDRIIEQAGNSQWQN